MKNREILKEKEYVKPYERQVKVIEISRQVKEEDKEIKQEIMQNVLHENPDISKEKAVAMVHKMVLEKKEKNKQEKFHGVAEESFKPDISVTVKKRTVKTFKHDGVYHLSEAVGKEIWSCCAKEEKNAQGCIKSIKDLDKWQTFSF